MMGCGGPDVLDGGTVTNTTVTNSTIQGSAINGSAISASSLSTLTGVDSPSAHVIADAIAKLDTEELRALAKAIALAMPLIEVSLGPSASVKDSLPTEVLGNRQALLGAPAGWLELRGVIVPAYAKQC